MSQRRPIWAENESNASARFRAWRRRVKPEAFRSWFAIFISACALIINFVKFSSERKNDGQFQVRDVLFKRKFLSKLYQASIENNSASSIEVRTSNLFVDGTPITDPQSLADAMHIAYEDLAEQPFVYGLLAPNARTIRPGSEMELFRVDLNRSDTKRAAWLANHVRIEACFCHENRCYEAVYFPIDEIILSQGRSFCPPRENNLLGLDPSRDK